MSSFLYFLRKLNGPKSTKFYIWTDASLHWNNVFPQQLTADENIHQDMKQ